MALSEKIKLGHWSRRAQTMTGLAVVVIAFIAWSLRPLPVPADFTTVTRGDLVVTIDDEGETRVKEIYIVSAPVAGRVERIELEVGDPVIANETVLALFQPQDATVLDARAFSETEAGVRLAEAERDSAAAQVDFAKAELERQRQLAEQGTISKAAFDRAMLQLRTSEAALNQAIARVVNRKTDLETARAALAKAGRQTGGTVKIDYIPVRAPVDGRVLKRMQQSEGILSAGTPLLEIGNPANLEIVTDLLSADAVRVNVGDDVMIEDWGGPNVLKGIVQRIEPFGFTKVSALGIEEQRVNVISDFVSPHEQWASLGHGYRVMTRIVTQKRDNVIKVPVSSLFRTDGDWSVFKVVDETARLQLVELGARNTLEAEIISGLAENDQVIMHPSDQVIDGVRVEQRE
ncbi:MAG: HlyD family efflux transporter periplasmic adaptor subunit [Rhodobacteraceae bacterium]|nr:HlyD family efflux transporter periplasmic adaptor subunit [Paracoccaceae bacterium]